MTDSATPPPTAALLPPSGGYSGGVPTVLTIQYLRAVAAILIAFHHAMAPPALAPYYPHFFAEFGVDLFFVISGYIIWTVTADASPRPLSFWKARILRIVPLYWIFTTMFVVVLLLGRSALFNPPELSAATLLASYLFVPTNVPIYSLGWTLNYEMYFYLVFGLCLFVPSRALRLALLALALCAFVVAGLAIRSDNALWRHYTDSIVLEFLAGVVLAATGQRLMKLPAMAGLALIAIGLLAIAYYAAVGSTHLRVIDFGIPAILIVAGALVCETLARKAPNRAGLLLGDASYSIYLAHPFAERVWYLVAVSLLGASTAPAALVIYASGAVVCGIAGGIASYLLLERPLLALGRRLTGRSTNRRTAHAQG